MSKASSFSDPPSSGLMKALNTLGRTRGSSGTPAPAPVDISPTPSRGFQTQQNGTNYGNNDFHNFYNRTIGHTTTGSGLTREDQRAQIRDISSSTTHPGSVESQLSFNSREMSPSTPQSGSIQDQNVHNQNKSYSVPRRSNSVQSQLPLNNRGLSPSPFHGFSALKPAADPCIPPHKSVTQLSAQFQARVVEIQQKVQRTSRMPRSIQESFIEELRKLGLEFNEKQRIIQHQVDLANRERDQLQSQLFVAQRTLEATISERDRALSEGDALRSNLNELRTKQRSSFERLNELERRWKKINDDLQEQLNVQEDQLNGKRTLWLEAHPSSSARRSVQMAARDPFVSPSANQQSSFGRGRLQNMRSPSIASPLQHTSPQIHLLPDSSDKRTPRHQSNLSNLPTGKARPAFELPWGSATNNDRVFDTEPGGSPSKALVLRAKEEDPAPGYQAAFATVYDLLENWAKTYADIPNVQNDHEIARSNDVLWAYMMNITYPGHRQDSHTHVITLLNNSSTRYWFVMRLAVTYCIKEMMSIETFYKFNPVVDSQLFEVKTRLLERGLANEARQLLIDQQTKAVKSIIDSPQYEKFRSNQLAHHTKRLRDMLGPLLNDGISRGEAGKDLGVITVTAWELSVKIFTSYLTFQVYFPETAAKFSAATMIAKDQPGVDSMHLQVQQTRLKLVITPVITMRDDRGTTIKAKNLHMSSVLTMQ